MFVYIIHFTTVLNPLSVPSARTGTFRDVFSLFVTHISIIIHITIITITIIITIIIIIIINYK